MNPFAAALRAYLRLVPFRVNLRIAARKMRRYGPRIRGRVLDVGAGDRPWRRFLPNVDRYVATNTAGHYDANARASIREHTDAWIRDASCLPFAPASFDAVLCFQVLSLVREPQRFFEEAARVLRPHGLLLLTTDFLYPQWSDTDVMRHTGVHLRALAEAAGLRVAAVESFGGIYSSLHANLTRYIRDYPQRAGSSRRPGARVRRLIALAGYLLFLPLWSAAGWAVYLLDRDRNDATAFTVNTLILCEKPAGPAGSRRAGVTQGP